METANGTLARGDTVVRRETTKTKALEVLFKDGDASDGRWLETTTHPVAPENPLCFLAGDFNPPIMRLISSSRSGSGM